MALSEETLQQLQQNSISPNSTNAEEEEEEEEPDGIENGTEEDDYDNDDDDYEDEEEEFEGEESRSAFDRRKLENLVRLLSSERVFVQVHDIFIKGNTKTKTSVIGAEFDGLKSATTMLELLTAADAATARLRSLELFDSASITLEAGPPEVPGTITVIVDVVENPNPISGDIGIFSKPEARLWCFGGSLKFKNLFGYGDVWDASGAYGWDQTSDLSVGFSLPRFKAPLMVRVSLLSPDWLKLSSYTERLLGLSLGLVATEHHDLAYDLSWRTLSDPSQISSSTIRRQLGRSLLSSVKYTYKVDRRDSHLRPTRGYAFTSMSQIGGLWPDSRSLRFLRQEFDLRCALPLGFHNAAINCGLSAGALLPWGRGFMNVSLPLPERFFMGGHISSFCSMAGPTMLSGFKSRGLGPTEARRLIISNEDNPTTSSGQDVLGGDLAVTAFADLSFDLPLKLFRESGIHGHVFACAGSLTKFTENEFQTFSFKKFTKSFRSSAGFGIIVPTKFFRMEINYCYLLKHFEHDRAKMGIQFGFSAPS